MKRRELRWWGPVFVIHQVAWEPRSDKKTKLGATEIPVQQAAPTRERMSSSVERSGPKAQRETYERFSKVYRASQEKGKTDPSLWKQVTGRRKPGPPATHFLLPAPGQAPQRRPGRTPTWCSGHPSQGVSLCCASHFSHTHATCHPKPKAHPQGNKETGPTRSQALDSFPLVGERTECERTNPTGTVSLAFGTAAFVPRPAHQVAGGSVQTRIVLRLRSLF